MFACRFFILCNSHVFRQYKENPRDNKRSWNKLLSASEICKHTLTNLQSAGCSVDSLHEGMDYNGNITRYDWCQYEAGHNVAAPLLFCDGCVANIDQIETELVNDCDLTQSAMEILNHFLTI